MLLSSFNEKDNAIYFIPFVTLVNKCLSIKKMAMHHLYVDRKLERILFYDFRVLFHGTCQCLRQSIFYDDVFFSFLVHP